MKKSQVNKMNPHWKRKLLDIHPASLCLGFNRLDPAYWCLITTAILGCQGTVSAAGAASQLISRKKKGV
jgi:hypothetical protein